MKKNNIESSVINWGNLFALIKYEKNNGDIERFKLNKNESELLSNLKNRANQILNQRSEILKANDENAWEDIIIDVFINSRLEDECLETITLINSKFYLFEKFNHVLIEFILKTKSLKKVS